MPDNPLPMQAAQSAAGAGWVEALRRAWEGLTNSVTRLIVPLKASTQALLAAAGAANTLAGGLAAAGRAGLAAQAALTASGRPALQLAAGLQAASAPAAALAAGIESAGASARRMAGPAKSAGEAAGEAGKAGKAAAENMGALSQRGLLVGAAYVYATARLRGFVAQALAGTTTGERLSYTTQQLQRSIGAAFVPAIEAVITKIQALTSWFQSLSGEQQQTLAKFTGIAAAALAAAAVLPKLGAAISALGISSPLLSVAAGLAAILARSAEGREALLQFGEVASETFAGVVRVISSAVLPILEAIANVIEAVVIPALDGLGEMLKDPAAKFVIFGGLVVAIAAKIILSFGGISAAVVGLGASIKAGFLGMLGPVGLVIGAVAAVATAIGLAGSKTKEFAKEAAALAEQVHKGQTTEAKAREEIRVKAALEAEEEAEKTRKQLGPRLGGALDIEGMREKRQRELEQAGNEAFDRILKRLGGRPRTELETARKEVVSPAELIRKIEQAALQKDQDAPKRTAEGIEKIWDLLRRTIDRILGKPDDKREDPPKAD